MNDNWKELIERTFEERYKFVHDVNYIKIVNMSTDFIRRNIPYIILYFLGGNIFKLYYFLPGAKF